MSVLKKVKVQVKRKQRPSTCKGVVGYSYEWRTHTRSHHVMNTLSEHARDRIAECVRGGCNGGELVCEVGNRTYYGRWSEEDN